MTKILKYSREYKKEDTVVAVKDVKIGGDYFAIAAGPCAIESWEQYYETAKAVKAAAYTVGIVLFLFTSLK